MLKIFIDEGKLIVNSQDTLNQLYTFTKEKNGNKYRAETGYKDDAVMALAFIFAPFMHIKVFDNFELFTRELHLKDSKTKVSEYLSVLDIGVSDDGSVDEVKEEQARLLRLELQGLGSDYGI